MVSESKLLAFILSSVSIWCGSLEDAFYSVAREQFRFRRFLPSLNNLARNINLKVEWRDAETLSFLYLFHVILMARSCFRFIVTRPSMRIISLFIRTPHVFCDSGVFGLELNITFKRFFCANHPQSSILSLIF